MTVEPSSSDGDARSMKVAVDDDAREDAKDATTRDDSCRSGASTTDDALAAFAHDELDRAKTTIARLRLEKHALVMGNKREGEARARAEVEARARAEAEAKALAAERGALTERERALRAFVEDKKAHDEALRRAREECARLTVALESERADMERAFAARTGAMRAECDARVAKAKKQAESTMTARMERSVKRILVQNRKMSDELRVQVNETDALHRRFAKANAEAESLRRRAAAADDVERERAELGAMRARDLRRAEEKITTLERGIRELMEAFETQKLEWERETNDLRRANDEEVTHLKRSLALKSRELVNIRRLAKEVVCHYEDL